MAFTYGKEIAKMKLVFYDNQGKSLSQTFSNLKSSATPDDIMAIATKIGSISTATFDHVTKLSEAEVVYS